MPDKQNICIVTQSHLCRNPRVLKEAIALSDWGYKVTIITGIISKNLHQQDLASIKSYPAIGLKIISDLSSSSFDSFSDRLLNKTGRLLKQVFQVETSLSLGYGSYKYLSACRKVNADLYICHQETGTYIGTILVRAGYRVAFDFEDWYSEDLLLGARKKRPLSLLRGAESFALNNAAFCLTTSGVLSEKLSEIYSCNPPGVIYNVFNTRDDLLNKPKDFSGTLKLFWFSQTIGPGRGLEQFIHLTGRLDTRVELHMLGYVETTYREQLKALMPEGQDLFFHEMVQQQELAEKIAGFDIGLALELNTPMSRNYTITNKFFQYLQAGLPIIASETDGQNEAFEKFKPGYKLSQNPSEKEILAFDKWLSNRENIRKARERAIHAAEFCNWEKESLKLISLIKNIFE